MEVRRRVPDGQWCLYVLRCADGSLYCGITNHLTRRIAQHNQGTGARYTRGRGPVKLVRSWPAENRSVASKEEAAFKKLTRPAKLAFLKQRARSSTARPATGKKSSARKKA